MRDVWLLFSVQLRDMTGWNRAFYPADASKRTGKVALLLFIYLSLLCCLPATGMYAYLLVAGLDATDMLDMFPVMLSTAVMLLSLVLAVLKTNGTLVGFKDYDALSALPVTDRSLATSRFLVMYAYDCIGLLLALLPSAAVYAYVARPQPSFYAIFLLTMPFLPLTPMCIGSALGLLVARFSGGALRKQYIGMILLLVVSGAILWLSAGDGDVMQRRIMAAGNALRVVGDRNYLSIWYADAFLNGSIPATAAFIAANTVISGVFLALYARSLSKLQAIVKVAPRRKIAATSQAGATGVLRALYRKEMKRYFASAIYVFNTGFGLLMALAGCVALAIKGPDLTEMMMDVPVDSSMIAPGAALALCFMLATINTTGTSISMEGKQIWILKALPVAGWQTLTAKALVCWTLAVPASLIGSTTCALVFRPGFGMIVWMYLFPLGIALWIALFGLFFNLHSYRFDWPNETVIVKQSLSAGIPMLVTLGIVAVGALLLVYAPWALGLLAMALYIACAALAAVLYRGADRRILALKA